MLEAAESGRKRNTWVLPPHATYWGHEGTWRNMEVSHWLRVSDNFWEVRIWSCPRCWRGMGGQRKGQVCWLVQLFEVSDDRFVIRVNGYVDGCVWEGWLSSRYPISGRGPAYKEGVMQGQGEQSNVGWSTMGRVKGMGNSCGNVLNRVWWEVRHGAGPVQAEDVFEEGLMENCPGLEI